jgi:hypothetical protein
MSATTIGVIVNGGGAAELLAAVNWGTPIEWVFAGISVAACAAGGVCAVRVTREDRRQNSEHPREKQPAPDADRAEQ